MQNDFYKYVCNEFIIADDGNFQLQSEEKVPTVSLKTALWKVNIKAGMKYDYISNIKDDESNKNTGK